MRRVRSTAVFVTLALASFSSCGSATAQDGAPAWRVGTSLMGDPKYKEGFQHFDYVNPDAPKGGQVRLSAEGSFDNFNIALLTVKGVIEPGVARVYQNLMTESQDEPFSEYGEIADAVRYPDDLSSVTFRINPKARWQDGQPVTPEDVVWSFQVQTANNKQTAFYYHDVDKAEVTASNEVTFRFSVKGNRELPQIVGQLFILPKHWWLANGTNGKPRDISATSLEPPMGSGPYQVKAFEAGRSVTYERVKDWWGADLPTAKGMYNFDEIRYEYYTNSQQMPEFFKSGSFDFRLEMSASAWVQFYKDDVPAIKAGRIVKQEFPRVGTGGMQAFGFNLRRPKFADPRVRRAFNDVFDFEEINRTLSFGQLTRISSYFFGLDFASKGLPQSQELAILDSIKDKVPPKVFTTPYSNPVNGTDEARRANYRDALDLLKQAGWEIRDRKLTNVATGEVMAPEILLNDDRMTRSVLPYKQSLARIGIDATVRVVDESQYQQRVNNRDFDIIVFNAPQTESPGNEQRDFWGSVAADQATSRNVLGIKNPAVDALVDRIIYAKDRIEQAAAAAALDRVLLANDYVVPQFTSSTWHTLRWNRFGQPAVLPTQKTASGGFPDAWWYDEALAAKTGAPK